MSRTIDALARGQLQNGLRAANKDVRNLTAEITGAKSEPVREAARVLVREMRRLVSTKATDGQHAAPGQPPLANQRRLRRSISTAVVDGVRRVGSSYFVARLLEFGAQGEDGGNTYPHPFARPALENVQGEMTDVIVTEAQKKIGNSR